jgi:hypothetical protein
MSESTPRRPWYQPSGADLVFLVAAVFIIQTARQTMCDDPGLGWHLRNIDAMRAEGGWLRTDSFSGPRGGQPYYSSQWLGELALWLGERWGGVEGIAAVATLLLAFLLRTMYGLLLRDGLPWPAAVFWTCLTAVGTSCSWAARPTLFTTFFVMLTARVCVLFHEGRLSRRATLWLLPLFCIWANTHGGFVAGFTLLAATSVIEAALAVFGTTQEGRQEARRRAAQMGLLLGGAFLATLVNPYGISLYSWIFQLLGEPYFMDLHQEWKSPDFHGRGAMRFELLLLLLPLLLAVSKRRPNVVELGLTLLWLHFALTGFRYVALYVVVAVPLLARSSMQIPWLQEQGLRLRLAAEGGSLFTARPSSRSWGWTLVFALVLLSWAHAAQGRFARHKPEILATQALDHLLQIHADWRARHGQAPVVFHSYDWGGYLTWHGWPAFRNWIDDRNEVQGKEHVQDYFSILTTQPGWEHKLEQANVQLICIQRESPLTYRLQDSATWREIYRDPYAVIFERFSPPDSAVSKNTRSAR